MLHVFARAKSKEGQAAELRVILRQLAETSRTEAGVLRYELFETSDSGEFLFHEEYSSREAFEAHRASPHVRRAVRLAYRVMDGGLTLWETHPV
jgi:quinol monooxygenase YgiN